MPLQGLVFGAVILPDAADLNRAILTVRLRDTVLADAPAPLMAAVSRLITERAARSLPFVMQLEHAASPDARPALEAELLAGGDRPLRAGDWLTVEHVPWPPVAGGPVLVPVQRVE